MIVHQVSTVDVATPRVGRSLPSTNISSKGSVSGVFSCRSRLRKKEPQVSGLVELKVEQFVFILYFTHSHKFFYGQQVIVWRIQSIVIWYK